MVITTTLKQPDTLLEVSVCSPLTVPSVQRPRRPWARCKSQGWDLNPYASNSNAHVKESLPLCFSVLTSVCLFPPSHTVGASSS